MTSAVFHRDLDHPLAFAVRGEGVYLYDDAGRRYLDASGGAAVSCLGHGQPDVVEAIKRQLDRVEFAHTLFFTNEPSERLARRLIDLAPEGFGQGRAMFLGSGSEAVEAALKLARQYHVERREGSRTRFIAREMSYHGNTLGALGVSGHQARRAIYQPLIATTSFVTPCYAYREKLAGESDAAFADRLADELDREIRRLGPETVAAFIAEPISGATLGGVPPVEGYFRRIREVCDRHGVLLIADEVMCGMGRTGHTYALEPEGIAPDIITVAKGLGAGFQPIGATLASEKVVAAVAAGSHRLANGHTYMSHPVAAAASLAVLDVIARDDLLGNVRRRGAEVERRLRQRYADHPNVGDIRGRGLLWGVELVEDRASKRPFQASRGLAVRLREAGLANGLVCYPGSGTADGVNGDHVLLAPPFTITPAQVDEMLDKLDATLAAVLQPAMA